MKARHHSTAFTSPDFGAPKETPTTEADEPQASTPNSCGPERIPPQWAWHYRTLLHLRDRLTRTHAEHAQAAVTPAEMLGVDIADTAQEQIDRDLLWAELASEDDQVFEIDCALNRIRDGVYGFCEETGHPIPPERLRAVPWTRYGRSVAEQRERRSRHAHKLRP
jgi:RNA polymerase-binding transcription factor DksA